MKNKITLLGTGTCQIEQKRMASSLLVELNGLRFIFDFGRGATQRLIELGLKQDDITHIILSHFHPDHISDLIPYLQAASWSRVDLRTKDLNMYGPAGTKNKLMRILNAFEPGELTPKHFKLKIHEIAESKLSIEGQDFEFLKLHHVDSYGVRFMLEKRLYALSGDSEFHQSLINFLSEADFAIIDSGHLDDGDIIELAIAAKAKEIVCSHQYRDLDQEKLNLQAKEQGYSGEIVVGNDLDVFEL